MAAEPVYLGCEVVDGGIASVVEVAVVAYLFGFVAITGAIDSFPAGVVGADSCADMGDIGIDFGDQAVVAVGHEPFPGFVDAVVELIVEAD